MAKDKFQNYKATTVQAYDKFSRFYKNENTQHFFWQEEFDLLLKLIKESGIKVSGCKFLDLGCGVGRDAALALKAGMKYTGVDLSKGMLKVARESFPQAEFHRMDVSNLDFRANTFDVVWASAILLHLDSKDLEKTLGEIKRVLKPEGLVFITLEKRGKGRQKKEMKNSQKGKNQVSRFFHLFKRKEFQEVLITNNFHILQTGQKSEESGEKEWLYFIAKV